MTIVEGVIVVTTVSKSTQTRVITQNHDSVYTTCILSLQSSYTALKTRADETKRKLHTLHTLIRCFRNVGQCESFVPSAKNNLAEVEAIFLKHGLD